jgi:hypothetical protein
MVENLFVELIIGNSTSSLMLYSTNIENLIYIRVKYVTFELAYTVENTVISTHFRTCHGLSQEVKLESLATVLTTYSSISNDASNRYSISRLNID